MLGSPSNSISSQETLSAAEPNEGRRSVNEEHHNTHMSQDLYQPVARRQSVTITLKDVACGPVNAVAACLREQPEQVAEDLKAKLRDILNGTGESHNSKEDFAVLQKQVLSRGDLSHEALISAHRAQLEILIAIKTGIPAFLHPDIAITRSILIDIFSFRRCRNMACQNKLPGDDCACEVCTSKSGFCNACMCIICYKFDFDLNTCRWIGCDFCSHWTHTECAIRVGQIAMGNLSRGGSGMLVKCSGCKNTSELFGWVKDVLSTCARGWEGEKLLKEFDCVCRIFIRSEDSKGRKLFEKCEEMMEKLKNGVDSFLLCKEMLTFFEEDAQEWENKHTKLLGPFEACNCIAEVMQEAMAKMDKLAEEKVRALKKARLALETCDEEVREKKRELQELQLDRQRRQQQISDLEAIVRLKVAEAEMFQAHANKARLEAEELQCIAAEKYSKVEHQYLTRYLELHLSKVEAERQELFEKIQMQDCMKAQQDAHMTLKIQELLKQVHSKNGILELDGPHSE